MKGSKKYTQSLQYSRNYAKPNMYHSNAITNEITDGTVSRKNRYAKRKKQRLTKDKKIRSTKINHDYE